MNNRSITLTLDMERFAVAGNHKQAQDAIGRMVSYAYNAYPIVGIYHDRNHLDMVAVYSHENNPRSFTVGAVWNKETKSYSFHS